MDPNKALEHLLLALERFEVGSSLCLTTVEECWEDLFEWLNKGGFPPDVPATIQAVTDFLNDSED